MKFTCEGCQATFSVPDDKLPPGKSVRIVCPKCRRATTVKRPETDPSNAPLQDLDDELFLDSLQEGGKAALICIVDSQLKDPFAHTVLELGFQPIVEEDPDRAVRRLRHGAYAMVILEEPEKSDDRHQILLDFVRTLPMSQRRNTFFCLLSRHDRTMDTFAAFRKEMDVVIHPADVDKAKLVFERELKSKKKFYRIFREALDERGQI